MLISSNSRYGTKKKINFYIFVLKDLETNETDQLGRRGAQRLCCQMLNGRIQCSLQLNTLPSQLSVGSGSLSCK